MCKHIQALQRYKTQTKGTETSDYEAMQGADAFFVTEAENCVRRGSDWDYASERASLQVCMCVYVCCIYLDAARGTHKDCDHSHLVLLQQTMNFIAQKNKKLLDVKSQAAQTNQQTMALLQQQQAQMMQLQNALGGGSPLNLGMSYRIPDTNINVQYTYQQGRTNVQFTCIPDDQVSLVYLPSLSLHHHHQQLTGSCVTLSCCLYIFYRCLSWVLKALPMVLDQAILV